MDTLFLMLTCCLSLSCATPTTEYGQLSLQNKSTAAQILHTTKATPLNSSEHLSTMTTLITDTTLTSTLADNNTSPISTSATVTNSSHSTFESTNTTMPLTTLLTTNSTANQTQKPTTSVNHTGDYTSVSETTTTVAIITSANSSTAKTTSESVHITQGLQLSVSERNMTIIFSVMLGVLALAVVAIKFHRWSHKLQFLHQPLDNTDDSNAFSADPDTLVISGGLYDDHPIYDNVPPARQDESNFRLEFLH